jgi:uncharacterized protein with NRDE domain
MGTIIIGLGCDEGSPLVVAANRDETLDRPAEDFSVRRVGERAYLAPRDLKSGGTWLGLSETGFFVGITNRFGTPPDLSRRSRGVLVTSALGANSAADAISQAQAVTAHDYNPFHLVVADRQRASVVWSNGEHIETKELSRGWHVVTERSFGAAPTRREAMLTQRVGSESLRELMSIHADPTFEGVCVHWNDRNYGTRSSVILRLNLDAQTELLSASGPPCITPWESVAIPAEFA